jgi:hypothetical protein
LQQIPIGNFPRGKSDMFPLYDVRKTSAQGEKPYANSLYSDEPSMIAASGGARRDRTDDLMLAKHALSQLSYGPVRRGNRPARKPTAQTAAMEWWAWEDLNFRPHAYQARALTN